MSEVVLLRGGWVLGRDGFSSAEAMDVRIANGVIVAVGTGLDPTDADVLDCTGATVLPGLIDAHVHLAMAGRAEPDTTAEQARARVASNARALLAAGITTARDVSGPSAPLLRQRSICAQDPTAGPQLLLSCEGIACVEGHGTEFVGESIVTEIDSPQAGRAAVRRLKEIGADWVKVMLNGADDQLELGEAELSAIVDEARILGIPVAAHASNARAVELAVHCGVHSIEHGNDITPPLAELMAQRDIAFVTTTHVYRAGAGCGHTQTVGDPLAAFEPRVQDKVRAVMRARVEGHEKAIPAAVAAGVRIVAGTDSVIGEISTIADELIALTHLGMTPAQALRAATVAGAELLGLPDRGAVEAGLRADLLVVSGRPDRDISAMSKPQHVLRGGAFAQRDGNLLLGGPFDQ